MIPEIINLPDISFIDDITLEQVQERMMQDYKDRYEEIVKDDPKITKKTCELNRADPMGLLLYACSVQVYQALLYIDRAGKQSLLKYSYGDSLDNLAALKGISREAAKPARTKIRFTLSEARKTPVGIPAGTKTTNGEIYFETEEYVEIAAGAESADILSVCMTTGTEANSLMPGEINILVDPIPYVASVSNVDQPDGGSEIEDDESLADRIYLAPSKYSVAGPDDAYIYWVKTFNSSIADVYVDSDDPVDVLVEFIMDNGELPEQGMIEGLENFLMNEDIRPLTDRVTVKAPDTVPYSINLRYVINASDTAKASTIQQAVTAAVNDYVVWQHSKIGRDINPSELTRRIVDAGAKRVEITQPIFTRVGKANVAKVESQTVTYGGIEDD